MLEVSKPRALSIESCLNCRPDLQPLIEQLQVSEIPEDRMAEVKYQVIKVRLKTIIFQKSYSWEIIHQFWVECFNKSRQCDYRYFGLRNF
jgi:hypothetical protein